MSEPLAPNWRIRLHEVDEPEGSLFGRMLEYATLRRDVGNPCAPEVQAERQAELLRLHRQAFIDWLALPLREQRNDLLLYFACIPDRRILLADLIEFGTAAIPPERRDVESQFFILDLATVQSLLMTETSYEVFVPTRLVAGLHPA